MANRLRKSPAVQSIPGVPGTPAIPAFCVDEPVYSDFGSYARELQLSVSLAETLRSAKFGSTYYGQIGVGKNGGAVYGPKTVGIPENLSSMFSSPGAGETPRVWYYLRKCYAPVPAKPSVPPRTIYSAVPGWNSGGLSLGGFAGDGYVQFVIGASSIGVVVGLNSRSDTVSPADCSHAFYGHQNILDIFESGAIVATVPGGLGSRPVLQIARSGGVVQYLVDGAVVHTSVKPSTGYARMDASLYVAGDYVDDPMMSGYNFGTASGQVGITAFIFDRPQATGRVGISGYAYGGQGSTRFGAASGEVGLVTTVVGYNTNYAEVETSIGVSGTATPAPNTSAGVIRGATGLAADRAYAQTGTTFRGGYEGFAEGGFPTVNFAYSTGYMSRPVGYAYGPSGSVGSAAGAMAPAQGAAGEDGYSFGRGIHRGNYIGVAYAPWLDVTAAEFREPILVSDVFTLFADAYADFTSVIEVADGMVVELSLEAGFEWLDAVMVASAVYELSDKDASWTDTVYVTDQGNADKLAGIQYATNTLSNAITGYRNFDFAQLIHTPSGSFGVRSDGLYRIGGDDDAGDLIDAYVDLGGKNFDILMPKHMVAMFFGMTTDGQVLAVLRDDSGNDRTYRVAQRAEFMRSNPAQAVTSKVWRLRLEVYGATQAELDSVEFMVSPTSRRWTR